MNAKQAAGERAASFIENEMTVGLGTGSTAYWAIQEIGRRVKEGLSIKAIATSIQSEEWATAVNIPLIPWADIEQIDCTIDGADEADASFQLIKGGGGALLREKIVAAASRQMVVVVDNSKMVSTLGKFPLPVEVIKFGHEMTLRHLQQLGCTPVLRQKEGALFETDNGNYIADCAFGAIPHPALLEQQLNAIPGVAENGLFVNRASAIVVGYEDGSTEVLEAKR